MVDQKPKIALELKGQQQLIMTPQLREAIGLLQLTNIELSGYLENELAENPFLEKDQSSPENDQDNDDAPTLEKPSADDGDEMEKNFGGDDSGAAEGFDTGSDWASVGKGGNVGFDDDEEGFENRLSDKKTLRDHLIQQLLIETDDPADRMIGTLLIDRLDEAGYLREPVEGLAKQLGCEPARVEKILKEMKTFDPVGVFAKDLSECLALQLADRDRLDPAMEKCVANLQKVAEGDLKGLARICGV
ncbi:MAG TPA: RNA polymerase sigma-54 factor, partial [Alphaproteobacteria bacterium]